VHRNPTLLLTALVLSALLAVGGCATKQAAGPTDDSTGSGIAAPAGSSGSSAASGARAGGPATEAMPTPASSGGSAPAAGGSAPGGAAATAGGGASPVTVAAAEAGVVDAFFAYDDFSLSPDAKSILARDGKFLKDNPAVRVKIEGHCDERGTSEYNLGLGERRAASARSYLVTLGVDASRIETISYGKERPFDPGHSEDAWAKNRRAHFVVLAR
jgi:peptidoglycan-associated lipoprotein